MASCQAHRHGNSVAIQSEVPGRGGPGPPCQWHPTRFGSSRPDGAARTAHAADDRRSPSSSRTAATASIAACISAGPSAPMQPIRKEGATVSLPG